MWIWEIFYQIGDLVHRLRSTGEWENMYDAQRNLIAHERDVMQKIHSDEGTLVDAQAVYEE